MLHWPIGPWVGMIFDTCGKNETRAQHPRLTRIRGIRFLQFEIILVLVYILTIFKLTDLFVLYFLFKTYMAEKKYLRKKARKLCLIGVIVIESRSFLEY